MAKVVRSRRGLMFAAAFALIVLAAVVYHLMRLPEEESTQKQPQRPAQDQSQLPVAAELVPADVERGQIEVVFDELLPDLFPADVELRAHLALDWPEGMTRIQRQIDVVSDESLAESMDNLYQVNMFTWPGAGREGGRGVRKHLPLQPARGESDLHSILSNRRFAKILQELSRMPKEAAAGLVADYLDRSLEMYGSLFADFVAGTKPYFRADSVRVDEDGGVTGPVWISRTEDEKKAVLLGARYNVLSLVWIAGSLGLTECHGQVKEIAQQSVVQRDWLYQNDELYDFYRSQVLEKLSLYNRQILAFALTRTSSRMAGLQHLLAEKGARKIRLETSRFDAYLSPYDLPVRSGYTAPDMSRGTVEIEYYAAVDDSTFDELLFACTRQEE